MSDPARVSGDATAAVLEAVPEVTKVPCVLCSERIDATARLCTKCYAYQIGKGCIVCGKWIPRDAGQCPDCHTYQDLRRFLPLASGFLAMLISLIAVVGALGQHFLDAINYRSKTTGYFVASDHDPLSTQKRVLFVRAINSGGRSSDVTSADLDLSPVTDRKVIPLSLLGKGRQEVPAGKSLEVRLYAEDSDFDGIADAQRAEVVKALCTGPDVTLNLHVDERNLFGSTHNVPRPVKVHRSDVRPFVADHLLPAEPEACK